MVCSAEKARQLFFKKVSNCYWNPKLEVIETETGDRTVIASESLREDDVLVVLNKDTTFGNDKAKQLTKASFDSIEESLYIPAYLYQYYTKYVDNAPSGYEHYFDHLPTYDWYAENHLLLKTFLDNSGKDLKKLGSNLFLISRILEMLEWIETIPDHQPQPEQAIRSILITSTRSWSSVGLVPWIDFFNHSYEGSILSNEGTTIKATHDYKKGAEVNTSYGLKDSLQLLSIYGFVSDEKTLTIYRPNVSPFAIAIDSDLKRYQSFSEEFPFLISKELNNFNSFIAHFRLTVLKKYDTLFVEELNESYKQVINGENELQSVKLAFACVKETEKHLNKIIAQIKSVIEVLPKEFHDDFEAKFEIIKALNERLEEHWNDLIK